MGVLGATMPCSLVYLNTNGVPSPGPRLVTRFGKFTRMNHQSQRGSQRGGPQDIADNHEGKYLPARELITIRLPGAFTRNRRVAGYEKVNLAPAGELFPLRKARGAWPSAEFKPSAMRALRPCRRPGGRTHWRSPAPAPPHDASGRPAAWRRTPPRPCDRIFQHAALRLH